MRGIIGSAAYLPHGRLDRGVIRAFLGSGGGKGSRTVASYDEDTTTLGVEAARLALRATPDARLAQVWFSTVAPAYLDKTNATAIHAALRLDGDVAAYDADGSVRSAAGALRAALDGRGTALVVSADIRTGLPGSIDESAGGDAGAALLIGEQGDGPPVLAEHLATASVSDEFLDRWRAPGESRTKQWEEKFGETRYVPLGVEAWESALKTGGLSADQVDRVIVTGPHSRAVKSVVRKLGVGEATVAPDLSDSVGYSGAAHAAVLLTDVLESSSPGQVLVLLSLADGADAFVFRTTAAIGDVSAERSVAAQVAAGGEVPYGKFLSWRGMLTIEPPRRPEPARPSASAAARSEEWKFAFVGSRDRASGAVHLPPARVSMVGGAIDDMEPLPMADTRGTIVTYTVDRMAYSPSPPVVFAVVDFDGGGRLPVELTDVEVADVEIGGRVEMTFRRLFTADGIHNYFWKARPVRG